ncbi:luciferase family protein [Nonomuraea lactucae]|uniref:luciferase family protein n=1 Tax=Nonomuraea lactucae TaxID=2249762 RepID=UPI0013B40D1F|nr:luciferase family protein [Nonomuraea lactucae]
MPATPGVMRAVAELQTWPDLRLARSRRGARFHSGTTEILRMTDGRSAQLKLTCPVINRWGSVLASCEQVSASADREWVTVQVDGFHDVELLLSLVSVAIKANR